MPSSPDEQVLVSPRYLAGEGDLGTVLKPLIHLHEWSHTFDRSLASVVATSHDGRLEVAMEPHKLDFNWWRVTCREAPSAPPRWEASFSHYVPVELIGAFTQALAADRYTRPEEIVAEDTASPTTAWRPLLKAGWHLQEDQWSTVLTSPDGRAKFGYSPAVPDEDGRRIELSEPWFARVTCETWEGDWHASFGAAVPARYLTFFAAGLADTAPVSRKRSQIPTPALSTATVRPARGEDVPRRFSAVEFAGALFNPAHSEQGNPPRRR
ncbi:DUF317 domain-containing protein [Streptacidiphilus sp. MAP5-52]|uniref:DUF317 domain-containing protein n=1 Tax=Streptacidiphilus sp. MAP5-52 TaxID=3156267 RepID=UPI0035157D82